MRSRTVVFFHAHPDDETLLTGGTMARLSAEGHRVVLVTATAGESGLAASSLTAGTALGELRRYELERAATALGCAQVTMLGYADSGMTGDPRPDLINRFIDADPAEAAQRVAGILEQVRADVVTIYDPAGGYGHPDHVAVHDVGLRAALLARTSLVLEATVDRRALQRALRIVRLIRRSDPDLRPERFATRYADPTRLTHRTNVRRFLDRKRAAMQAHASQATADNADRSLAWFLRLPPPVFARVFGHEWYVEHGARPRARLLDDPLQSLR